MVADERKTKSNRLWKGLTDVTDMTDCGVQTTLRIDDDIFRQAKAEAAKAGVTLTKFIEQALVEKAKSASAPLQKRSAEIDERNRLMEALLRRTAHFRVGRKPTREEMNAR